MLNEYVKNDFKMYERRRWQNLHHMLQLKVVYNIYQA
jgi:hypothetical protein